MQMFPPTQEHLHRLLQTRCCHSSRMVTKCLWFIRNLDTNTYMKKSLSDSVNTLIAHVFLHTFPSYVDINLDCWLNLSAALYIEEYTMISPVSISQISTFFGLVRMCFRKLYLGFISDIVFSRSGSEVIVVMFVVSGNNPLLINTSISSDLL